MRGATLAWVLLACLALGGASERRSHGLSKLLARGRSRRQARDKHRHHAHALTPVREVPQLERLQHVKDCGNPVPGKQLTNFELCETCLKSETNTGMLGGTATACSFCAPNGADSVDPGFICTAHPNDRHGAMLRHGADCKGQPTITQCRQAHIMPDDTRRGREFDACDARCTYAAVCLEKAENVNELCRGCLLQSASAKTKREFEERLKKDKGNDYTLAMCAAAQKTPQCALGGSTRRCDYDNVCGVLEDQVHHACSGCLESPNREKFDGYLRTSTEGRVNVEMCERQKAVVAKRKLDHSECTGSPIGLIWHSGVSCCDIEYNTRPCEDCIKYEDEGFIAQLASVGKTFRDCTDMIEAMKAREKEAEQRQCAFKCDAQVCVLSDEKMPPECAKCLEDYGKNTLPDAMGNDFVARVRKMASFKYLKETTMRACQEAHEHANREQIEVNERLAQMSKRAPVQNVAQTEQRAPVQMERDMQAARTKLGAGVVVKSSEEDRNEDGAAEHLHRHDTHWSRRAGASIL